MDEVELLKRKNLLKSQAIALLTKEIKDLKNREMKAGLQNNDDRRTDKVS